MRKKGHEPEPPQPMSLKDKLQLWAWIAGFGFAFAVFFHLDATSRQRHRLDALLQRWRSQYHLDDEQSRHILAMEESFHGSGDPLFAPAHTREETTVHHRAMASVMNPEDGERFFKAQESSAARR